MGVKFLTIIDKNSIMLNCGVDGVANISLDEIKSVEKISRSSFRHPIIGVIFSILLIIIPISCFSISSLEGAFYGNRHVGLVSFSMLILFCSGIFILADIIKSKKIQWVFITTNTKKHLFPINLKTKQDAEQLIKIIQEQKPGLIIEGEH